MTNFEDYKDEIFKIVEGRDTVAVRNGRPVPCNSVICLNCDLHINEYPCGAALIKWLYADNVKAPLLTKVERSVCELIGSGWIARDMNGDLYVYKSLPEKESEYWRSSNSDYTKFSDVLDFIGAEFSFILWENETPWSIDELLSLEVEE